MRENRQTLPEFRVVEGARKRFGFGLCAHMAVISRTAQKDGTFRTVVHEFTDDRDIANTLIRQIPESGYYNVWPGEFYHDTNGDKKKHGVTDGLTN